MVPLFSDGSGIGLRFASHPRQRRIKRRPFGQSYTRQPHIGHRNPIPRQVAIEHTAQGPVLATFARKPITQRRYKDCAQTVIRGVGGAERLIKSNGITHSPGGKGIDGQRLAISGGNCRGRDRQRHQPPVQPDHPIDPWHAQRKTRCVDHPQRMTEAKNQRGAILRHWEYGGTGQDRQG